MLRDGPGGFWQPVAATFRSHLYASVTWHHLGHCQIKPSKSGAGAVRSPIEAGHIGETQEHTVCPVSKTRLASGEMLISTCLLASRLSIKTTACRSESYAAKAHQLWSSGLSATQNLPEWSVCLECRLYDDYDIGCAFDYPKAWVLRPNRERRGVYISDFNVSLHIVAGHCTAAWVMSSLRLHGRCISNFDSAAPTMSLLDSAPYTKACLNMCLVQLVFMVMQS